MVQCAHFMPHIGSGEEVCLAYSQLVQTLDELVRRVFSEWSQSLDRQSLKRLDQPLMVRCKEKQGMLDINFDKWVHTGGHTHAHTHTRKMEESFRRVFANADRRLEDASQHTWIFSGSHALLT